MGLLPSPRRSESGYRLYTSDERERLQLIKRAKLLGLTLSEIKEIVEYAIDGQCGVLQGRLLALVEAKLGEIDQTIRDLAAFREDLRRYQQNLSSRLLPGAEDECRLPVPNPCDCIGEDLAGLSE